MMNHLNFASPSAYIDVPAPVAGALLEECHLSETMEWADHAVKQLERLSSGIVFRVGLLRLSQDESRMLAHSIAHTICAALKIHECPSTLKVEIDRPQKTIVEADRQVRTLLPHNDGGHCSYLTPSLLDVPDWDSRQRRFSLESGYTTTQKHKMYQGIFIADPGNALSITTYYDWLAILRRAYIHTHGSSASSVEELARWLGANISVSLSLQPQHQSRYLSLGSALGARRLVYHAIAVHYADADFSSHELERFPELEQFRKSHQASSTVNFLNQMLLETMDMTWQEVREHYETCLVSERYDFVLGHNLALVHGGLMGDAKRLLEPICMVVDDAQGKEYETWLARTWRRAV